MAEKFKVDTAKDRYTPMEIGFKHNLEPLDSNIGEEVPYRSLIGNLLYIARQTRPEITFAVNLLSKYVTKPAPKHWKAAKRILIYLKTTKDYSLRIGPQNKDGLKVYSDATWADDELNRLSRTGGVILYNGSLLNAYSHQQRIIALSSCQAEYQALASSVQEILYFRQLLGEIGYSENVPTPLICDNQGALFLAITTKNHPRVKHIAINYHFVREAAKDKLVNLLYIPTDEQVADIPLRRFQFEKLRNIIGVQAWGILKKSVNLITEFSQAVL